MSQRRHTRISTQFQLPRQCERIRCQNCAIDNSKILPRTRFRRWRKVNDVHVGKPERRTSPSISTPARPVTKSPTASSSKSTLPSGLISTSIRWFTAWPWLIRGPLLPNTTPNAAPPMNLSKMHQPSRSSIRRGTNSFHTIAESLRRR
jgi:hypothetical protein